LPIYRKKYPLSSFSSTGSAQIRITPHKDAETGRHKCRHSGMGKTAGE
jgi:hypothetical protein